jgi:hypothetical protein
MPEFVRVQDKDTGHKFTLTREAADGPFADAVTVVDEDALDALGNPRPAEATVRPGSGYADMKADELRAELNSRQLSTTGTKSELAQRLTEDDAQKGSI